MDKKQVLQANDNLEVYVFNVGRGLAVLIKTPHNHVMLYDLGSSEELSPIADIYQKQGFFFTDGWLGAEDSPVYHLTPSS